MEVSQVTAGASFYANSAQADRISEVVKQQPERLEPKPESSTVQLSAQGQRKAAEERVQQAAEALQNAAGQTSFETVKKATQDFVDAVNKQRSANQGSIDDRNIRERTQASDSRLHPPTAETRPAEGNGGARTAALKEVGITVAKDDTLKFDAKQLEKAFDANPAKVAETLGRTAKEASAAQVANNDGVSAAAERMKEQLRTVQQNQADNQARLESAQRAVDQRNQQVEQARSQTQQAFGFGGVSAYKGVLSF